MLYVIPLIIYLFGFFYCDLKKSKKFSPFLQIITFVYLTLLIGLRFEVGGDTINYMYDYEWRVPLSEWTPSLLDKFQPGYVFLCSLAKSISPDFYVFQLIHVFILNLFIYIYVNKTAEYKFLSFAAVYFLCYIYFSTEILRESLAVLVFLFNYDNYRNSRWLKYYWGVLISCLFHISAVFLLILPVLSWLKFDRKFIFILLVGVFAVVFLDEIFILLSRVAVVGEKVSAHAGMSSLGFFADLMGVLRRTIFPCMAICLIKYGMKLKFKFENPIAIMALFGVASFFSPIIFGRSVNYFIIFFAIAFADAIGTMVISKRVACRNNAKILILTFLLVYGSEYVMYNRYERFLPYYSIFNPISVNRDNFDRNNID